jgi:TRAP-type C4-dicarboxylate transport system permease small subunit
MAPPAHPDFGVAMSSFGSMLGRLQRVAEVLAGLLLASVFVVFLLQILFRYVLLMPVGWTVEWVTIAWVWVILFGAAFALRDAELIRLDVLYLAVPDGVRRVFDVITGLTCAAILAWTLPQCLDYIQFMKIERTAYLRWPFNWVFAIYIPFALAMIARCLWQVACAVSPALARTHRHD